MIPGVQAMPDPPLELIVKNAQLQVGRVSEQQTILRFLIPGAGIAIGIPLSDVGRETLIAQLRGADIVIAPSMPVG